MSLFEEFFDVSEEQHEKIKNNPKFTQILAPENTNGQPSIVPDCGKEILEQIENKHYYLWIEGGCELNAIYTQRFLKPLKNTWCIDFGSRRDFFRYGKWRVKRSIVSFQ